MGLNITIIILGGIIVLIALALFIKEQRATSEELPNSFLFQGPGQQDLIQLKNEVKALKSELGAATELLRTMAQEPKPMEVTEEEAPFDQLLNYNRFTKKNERIIQLYQSGETPESIARKLEKSLREVEMVIKLIK
ncbi:DUF6115 domain-containing protein [Alkaliphilus crotonatoxidans]